MGCGDSGGDGGGLALVVVSILGAIAANCGNEIPNE